jgi:hypothetical protein
MRERCRSGDVRAPPDAGGDPAVTVLANLPHYQPSIATTWITVLSGKRGVQCSEVVPARRAAARSWQMRHFSQWMIRSAFLITPASAALQVSTAPPLFNGRQTSANHVSLGRSHQRRGGASTRRASSPTAKQTVAAVFTLAGPGAGKLAEATSPAMTCHTHPYPGDVPP